MLSNAHGEDVGRRTRWRFDEPTGFTSAQHRRQPRPPLAVVTSARASTTAPVMGDQRGHQQEMTTKTPPPPTSTSPTKDEEPDESDSWPELRAVDHFDQFDPIAYLSGFYKSPQEDDAMKIVLFFLPGMLYRVPIGGSLLDLGAGPTVYVPMTFRQRVDHIYTSDFAPVNRAELRRWWLNEPDQFDWSAVCAWISSIETGDEKRHTQHAIEQATRAKIRAVLAVNVHNDDSVIDRSQTFPEACIVPQQFDIITTVFCLEYASETFEQYRSAVRNALKLLKPGGYLVQGGVFHAKHYSFAGRRWRCHFLRQPEVLQCLAENGMETSGEDFKLICREEIFVLVSRKKDAVLIGAVDGRPNPYPLGHFSFDNRSVESAMEHHPATADASNQEEATAIHTSDDYIRLFNPNAYLDHFYSNEATKDGTRLSLFALPVFARVIYHESPPGERLTLLDVGAGPTIYVALSFRETVEKIWLSDYVERNLHELRDWASKKSTFDWSGVIHSVARSEGSLPVDRQKTELMQEETRRKVNAGGVLHCDVHQPAVLTDRGTAPATYDVVVSIFCLESACDNFESYCRAMRNIVSLVKPGGRFILGSVIEDHYYQFGRCNRFELLYLTEEEIMSALDQAGIDVSTVRKYLLEEDGAAMIMGKKRMTP
uniref:Uncharacterized protein n=1 Tax=Plectus sambesii TaxID=2011161 RepID=A0A914W3V5_9BILA